MENVYPGSSVMREQGWNPYKEEEEMIQSTEAGPDGVDRDRMREERVWRDEDSWQDRENVRREGENQPEDDWRWERDRKNRNWKEDDRERLWRENDRRREEEPRRENDRRPEEEPRRENDRRREEEPRRENDRGREEESRRENEIRREEGSRRENDRRQRGELWTEDRENREWNDCRGRNRQCGSGKLWNMDIPELNAEEKNDLRQDCWRAVDWGAAGTRNGLPYQRYDHMSILKEEQGMERELRRLQSMYPQAARDILPMVEDACDRMEYEGSMMFDEMPDQSAVRKISDGIYEKIRGLYPAASQQQAQRDEVLSMQYQARRRRPPDGDFLQDLVHVMLIQEIHRRRCRHRRCRRM